MRSRREDDIFYGEQAEAVIVNPAYQQAMVRLRAKMFEQFGGTGFFQRRKREELWKMKRVMDDFEQELELMMRDCRIAKDDLAREDKLKSVKTVR